VPKSGQLVVHFLRATGQSARLYHNVTFDHKDTLPHQIRYARFAWALMKIFKDQLLDPTNVIPNDGRGGRGSEDKGKGKAEAGPSSPRKFLTRFGGRGKNRTNLRSQRDGLECIQITHN
jgi:hypothetical protein